MFITPPVDDCSNSTAFYIAVQHSSPYTPRSRPAGIGSNSVSISGLSSKTNPAHFRYFPLSHLIGTLSQVVGTVGTPFPVLARFAEMSYTE
ncbi:MAG: hypothetical protein KGJ59_06400 [Bacteroidota bacterium]|nr:hypothetical protein [Bacteroidota bacterium]